LSFGRAWQTGSGTSRAIILLKPKYGLTPISCRAVLERVACAPFIKERRMEYINATSLRRKSGQMGHPAFVAGVAKAVVRSSDSDPDQAGSHADSLAPEAPSLGAVPVEICKISEISEISPCARPTGW
jgi:hypothetical protein